MPVFLDSKKQITATLSKVKWINGTIFEATSPDEGNAAAKLILEKLKNIHSKDSNLFFDPYFGPKLDADEKSV